MPTHFRIVTRRSALAMWQARHVQGLLQTAHPNLAIEVIGIQTRGDKLLDAPLAKIGGKGLFIKELEHVLLDGKADIAVHSMKDVPVDVANGLDLAAILQREDPRDALVSRHYTTIERLPAGAVVGTSSLRRQCQIKAVRPDLTVRALRGNVDTRIRKLDDGEYDAIILAAAGIKRLGLEHRISSLIPTGTLLPAIGQGAIGIECRRGDHRTEALIRVLDHPETRVRIRAERAINANLGGGCQVPIAGFAELRQQHLRLEAVVGTSDGTHIVRGAIDGPMEQAEILGKDLAQDLLAQGARSILDDLMYQSDDTD